MARKKKNLHYGSRSGNGGPLVRMAVSDRTSKSARPWNHPEVVKASQAYGVSLNSYKQVHLYENILQNQGSLEDNERFTCRDCGMLNSEHEEHEDTNGDSNQEEA